MLVPLKTQAIREQTQFQREESVLEISLRVDEEDEENSLCSCDLRGGAAEPRLEVRGEGFSAAELGAERHQGGSLFSGSMAIEAELRGAEEVMEAEALVNDMRRIVRLFPIDSSSVQTETMFVDFICYWHPS